MSHTIARMKQFSAFKWMAILLGLTLPGFYWGQAVGMLIVVICFTLLLAPSIRPLIRDVLFDLWRKPESKWLVAFFVCLIPSVIFSVTPLTSLRTWGAGVLLIALLACLTVFAKAPLENKVLAVKIMIIGLLLWHVYISIAHFVGYFGTTLEYRNMGRSMLIGIWSIRGQLDLLDKSWSYYFFSKPKFLLNSSFIVLPLLIYYGAFCFKERQWRIAIFIVIISYLLLGVFVSNRAMFAGMMAMALVATCAFWASPYCGRLIRFVIPILFFLTLGVFYVFLLLPRIDALNNVGNQEITTKKTIVTKDIITGQKAQFNIEKELPHFLPYSIMQVPRQVFLVEAIKQWKHNPLTGIGINTTPDHLGLQQNIREYFLDKGTKDSATYVHNRFIEVLLEAGLFGFIPMFIFLITLTLRHLHRYIKHGYATSLVLVLAHTGYWVAGLFQLSMWNAWVLMIFATILIMLHSLAADEKPISAIAR